MSTGKVRLGDLMEAMASGAIRPGPIRHKTLSAEMLRDIRDCYDRAGKYWVRTLEEFEIGFMRDAEPEIEIAVWKRIANAAEAYGITGRLGRTPRRKGHLL